MAGAGGRSTTTPPAAPAGSTCTACRLSFAHPPGSTPHGFGLSGQLRNFKGPTVDVVLRPSVETAEATLNTFEVWAGDDIVIEDVPVERK